MAFINEGRFNMGQKNNLDDEVPVHRLFVSAFFISQNEVTLGDWKKVVIWAEYNGYNFSNHQYVDICQFTRADVERHEAVKEILSIYGDG